MEKLKCIQKICMHYKHVMKSRVKKRRSAFYLKYQRIKLLMDLSGCYSRDRILYDNNCWVISNWESASFPEKKIIRVKSKKSYRLSPLY